MMKFTSRLSSILVLLVTVLSLGERPAECFADSLLKHEFALNFSGGNNKFHTSLLDNTALDSSFVSVLMGFEYILRFTTDIIILNNLFLSLNLNYNYLNLGNTAKANDFDKLVSELSLLGLGNQQFLTTLNVNYALTSAFTLFTGVGMIVHNAQKSEQIAKFFDFDFFKDNDMNDNFKANVSALDNRELLSNVGLTFIMGFWMSLSEKYRLGFNMSYNRIPLSSYTKQAGELPKVNIANNEIDASLGDPIKIPVKGQNLSDKTFGYLRDQVLQYMCLNFIFSFLL